MPASSDRPEALGGAIAQVFAPFLIAELRRLGVLPPDATAPPQTAAPTAPAIHYDAPTCATFAAGLGDNVLQRASTMFRLLAATGQLDSTTLLRALPEARTTPHLADHARDTGTCPVPALTSSCV
jgi:hypothetical protein